MYKKLATMNKVSRNSKKICIRKRFGEVKPLDKLYIYAENCELQEVEVVNSIDKKEYTRLIFRNPLYDHYGSFRGVTGISVDGSLADRSDCVIQSNTGILGNPHWYVSTEPIDITPDKFSTKKQFRYYFEGLFYSWPTEI